MAGPGEYVADGTEGITRVEDLPKPKVAPRSRNFRGDRSKVRHSAIANGPSSGRCTMWGIWSADALGTFTSPTRSTIAANARATSTRMCPTAPKSHYTYRVTTRPCGWSWRRFAYLARVGISGETRVFVPYATIQNWVEAGGTCIRSQLPGFSAMCRISFASFMSSRN